MSPLAIMLLAEISASIKLGSKELKLPAQLLASLQCLCVGQQLQALLHVNNAAAKEAVFEVSPLAQASSKTKRMPTSFVLLTLKNRAHHVDCTALCPCLIIP